MSFVGARPDVPIRNRIFFLDIRFNTFQKLIISHD